MTVPTDPLDVASRYFAAIERDDRAAVEALLDPAVVQHELPNRLVPAGAVRDRAAILDAFDRGRRVVSRQRFAVEHALAQGDHVALEVTWTGVLAVAVGTLAAGDTLRARFAVFMEIREGRVVAQRNYDCFDP